MRNYRSIGELEEAVIQALRHELKDRLAPKLKEIIKEESEKLSIELLTRAASCLEAETVKLATKEAVEVRVVYRVF